VATNDILGGRASLIEGPSLNIEQQKSAPSMKQEP